MINQAQFRDTRESLITYLNWLSDKSFQEIVWVLPNSNRGYYYGLKPSLDLIFEEMDLEGDSIPYQLVGYILKNEHEAEVLTKVVKLLDSITTEAKCDTDEEYLDSPLRPKLIEAAKDAYKVFIESEKNNKEFLQFIEEVKANMQKKAKEKLGT